MLGEEPMPDLSEEDSEGEEEEEEDDEEDGEGDDAGDGALPMYSDEGSSEGEEGDDDEDDNEEVGFRLRLACCAAGNQWVQQWRLGPRAGSAMLCGPPAASCTWVSCAG